MIDIQQDEIMTSPGEWNASIIDNPISAVDQRLKELPTTPINATDDFYNIEGEINVQRSKWNFKWVEGYVSLTKDDDEEINDNGMYVIQL